MGDFARMPHQLYGPTQHRFNPILPFAVAVVAAINPQMAKLGEVVAKATKQPLDPVTVHNPSTVDFGFQHQPWCIDQNMALAPSDLLAAVIPTSSAHSSWFDRLTIDTAWTWLGIPTKLLP